MHVPLIPLLYSLCGTCTNATSSHSLLQQRKMTQIDFEPKKWDARYAGQVPHDSNYYAKCVLGGILACGLSHTANTPLDVAKCRKQVYPEIYTGSPVSTLRTIIAKEGPSAIWKGWAPTLIGYSMQGACKFGLYEVFKDLYSNILGEEKSKKYKALVWCAGSATAEVFADIALCPMEMVKVKVQTVKPGEFPTAFLPATIQMARQREVTRFPFGSLVPLWGRQIPYNVAKFYFFEKCVSMFYTHVFTQPKESYSKLTQLGVTFASGYLAGVICALVSQPADSMVSQLSKAENKGKSMRQIANEVGFVNLATKGLGTRVFMVGTLTGIQWWIYDTFKTAYGLGTTGSK